jgi:hypothetical protein
MTIHNTGFCQRRACSTLSCGDLGPDVFSFFCSIQQVDVHSFKFRLSNLLCHENRTLSFVFLYWPLTRRWSFLWTAFISGHTSLHIINRSITITRLHPTVHLRIRDSSWILALPGSRLILLSILMRSRDSSVGITSGIAFYAIVPWRWQECQSTDELYHLYTFFMF